MAGVMPAHGFTVTAPVVRRPGRRSSVSRCARGGRCLPVFFVVPLIAMLDFSTRTLAGTRTGKAWATLLNVGTLSTSTNRSGTGCRRR